MKTSTEIRETTGPEHVARGERAVVITHEGGGSRIIVALTIHRSHDVALDGDAPIYSTASGAIAGNADLARVMSGLLHSLLSRPHESTLAITPDDLRSV